MAFKITFNINSFFKGKEGEGPSFRKKNQHGIPNLKEKSPQKDETSAIIMSFKKFDPKVQNKIQTKDNNH